MGILRKIADRVRLVGEAREVKRLSGKGLLRQLSEVVRLRLGPTHLHEKEYYAFRLWDDALYPEGRAGVGGDWLSRYLHRQLNNKAWEVLMTDKLASAAVFEMAGLPYPTVVATVSPGRRFGNAPNLRSREELAAFLRGPCPYPAFLKPIKGSYGRGCLAVAGYEAAADELRLGDGAHVGVGSFLAGLCDPTGYGFIVLRRLESHPRVSEVTGSATVASCRVAVLLGDDGPRIFRVVLKLPTGRNITDNFRDGTSGNIIAHVDRETGVVRRAIRGAGLELARIERHPDTDRAVVGMQVPDWDELGELVKRAAPVFAGARWQSWDIGLTAEGPVLLELNSSGGVILLSLAPGRGVYDQDLHEFLARYRCPEDVPGPLFPQAPAGRRPRSSR